MPRGEDGLAECFESIRKELENEGCYRPDLLFEFVVPIDALHHRFDQWKTLFGATRRKVSFGFTHPLVVRIDTHAGEADVKDRWVQNDGVSLTDAANQALATQHVVTVAQPPVDDPFEDYMANRDLMCVVATSPLESQQQIEDAACPLAASDAGIPIIVWARCPNAAESLEQVITQSFSGNPRSVWRDVWRSIRQRSGPTQEHFTLIMEQDYFLNHDKQLRQQR